MTHVQVDTELFKKLRQKVVVVTGGSSGIGLATVKLLAANGALIVNGDISPVSGEDAQENSSMTFQKTDVSNWSDLCSLFSKAMALHGRVDHVFANAGIGPQTTYMDLQMDESGQPIEPSQRVLDVNLKGLINTVALAIHYMKASVHEEGGSIVITGSASSIQNYPPTDYTISKHGALGVMRGIYPNLQHQKLPIRINTILPSWTATGMIPEEVMKSMGIQWQPAERVADAVGLLMADVNKNGLAIFIHTGVLTEIEEDILVKAAYQDQEPDAITASEEYFNIMDAKPKSMK